jgi:hypothetical protein
MTMRPRHSKMQRSRMRWPFPGLMRVALQMSEMLHIRPQARTATRMLLETERMALAKADMVGLGVAMQVEAPATPTEEDRPT